MTRAQDVPRWSSPEAIELLPVLAERGEGQTVEFKEQLPAQGHDIAKSIAAFASSGTGYLIYGVSDNGAIVGLPGAANGEGRDHIERRILTAAKEIRPPVHPEVMWAPHQSVAVCIVKVEKGFEALYYSNQRPIVRRGNTSRPAEPGEVEQVFRLRYAGGRKAPALPSTRQIAERMRRSLELMNERRSEQIGVVDLARAMDHSSPADLDSIFSGHLPASFAMLDQFSERFAVNKEWLTTGRGTPFCPAFAEESMPERYFDLFEELKPDTVFAVRSAGSIGEAFFVLEIDPYKFMLVPGLWHVSDHVGGGGSRQLYSLYKLFKRWIDSRSFLVIGRQVDEQLSASLFNGESHPGLVANQPLSHWWDDLTDLEFHWTSRQTSAKRYGKGFVAAQDIIRKQLEE